MLPLSMPMPLMITLRRRYVTNVTFHLIFVIYACCHAIALMPPLSFHRGVFAFIILMPQHIATPDYYTTCHATLRLFCYYFSVWRLDRASRQTLRLRVYGYLLMRLIFFFLRRLMPP